MSNFCLKEGKISKVRFFLKKAYKKNKSNINIMIKVMDYFYMV